MIFLTAIPNKAAVSDFHTLHRTEQTFEVAAARHMWSEQRHIQQPQCPSCHTKESEFKLLCPALCWSELRNVSGA